MRACGRRYPSQEAAWCSKRASREGARVLRCALCRGWHVKPPAGPRKPLPRVSARRAREIRERRAMLQALYPDLVLCEVPHCNEVATDPHEPKTRARGGSITDPENLKAICRRHHREVTDEEPEWAYGLGFLRHSWDAGKGAA